MEHVCPDRMLSRALQVPDEACRCSTSRHAAFGSMIDDFRDFCRREAFHKEALDQAAIVAVTDVDGTIRSVNRKFCELSGYSEAELIGANHRILRSGLHDRSFFRDLYRTIGAGEVWHGEICNRAKSGQLYWVDTTIVPHRAPDGTIDTYTAIRFEITRQKQAEERLWRLAHCDVLTGLPNRLSFMGSLGTMADRPPQLQTHAIGLMDVDHFKDINDTLGHAAGDQLLVEIGRRLRLALEPDDVVARLGGDEFALLFADNASPQALDARIARIHEVLAEPVWLGGDWRRISASFGIACAPHAGRTASEFLKSADIALYAAKEAGRGRHCFFNEDMQAHIDQRATLLTSFGKGLESGEFRVHYQPIVEIAGHSVMRLEALLRWRHPEHGLVGPADFSEALDDTMLATLADQQVLEIVLADIAAWKRAGTLPGPVGINAALGDFNQPGFVERILRAIGSGEIEPRDLYVEITEGMLIGHLGSMARTGIARLHEAGVAIALDDFGTGYASLRHLRDLPVDTVKIDKDFILSLESDHEDRAVVEGIIRMSHNLGKSVVAEGVETARQEEILRDLGCDAIQGFLIARPMSACALAGWLARPAGPGSPPRGMTKTSGTAPSTPRGEVLRYD